MISESNYISNEKANISTISSLSYRMEWEADMKEYLKKLEKVKPVIFCGDLNVAHNEIGKLNTTVFNCFTKQISRTMG